MTAVLVIPLAIFYLALAWWVIANTVENDDDER